ncbi:hypothetical protein C3F09_11695 [candidate division GN15 bacterium]|uniref:Dockerin domain-containing protein n=1 Tax=candidate division GN15 bacterium TaxID=2072418 RepID=A0A855X373_9BACT|nr:MAG: hypothetical protein C3F09_11695 [candidate division GN15 bacterium]
MLKSYITAAGIAAIFIGGVAHDVRATIHTINMSGFSFSPLNTAVHYGDTVRWHNLSGVHTSTSDIGAPKVWTSGTMSSGQDFDVVFVAGDGPGPFSYHCEFHVDLGMVDTIRIAPASCCTGKRGNVNMAGIVDLSDLSALVSYLTGGGFVLPCVDAANVNAAGIVDLSDLSALVSYLTGGGFDLPNCP